MARAYGIFVVSSGAVQVPVAAFTVKHECIRWLRKFGPEELCSLGVYRLQDNRPNEAPTWKSAKEFS